ncbi:MAG: DUF2267 domain-containing protein [Candidatus Gastranaerophilales bacterium]|nr:DUF2267 domain-containing protein [Candidatus Gastranaerophilales bacterium]
MNTNEFIKKVMDYAQIEDKHEAERGILIVFSILSHRLQEEESKDVASQLPAELKKMWFDEVWITSLYNLKNQRLKFRHLTEFIMLVENELLRENLKIHAEKLTKAVFHILKEQIAAGESEDIVANLPREIGEFYKAA